MADDLDSFLQRAAQQRQKRKQAEIVILEPSSPAAPQRPAAPPPRQIAPQRPLAPAPAPPVIVIAEPVQPRGEDIASHVATHLSNREFDQRASHLGERVGLADDDLEAHLKQVFDHNVSSIGQPGTARATNAETAAANMSLEIMAAFRDANSMRRAIILNEVLTPSWQRWQF